MKIEVLHNYGSIQMGVYRIEPGVYELDDPALRGQGQYLVDNGHARVIEDTPEVETPDEGISEETEDPTPRQTRRNRR